MCKLAILFAKSINFKQLYELQTPNVCTAVRCETVANKQTFTLTNKCFFDFIPNTVVGQRGNSLPEIVGVPAEQRSSLWCKSAYSEAPGAFSAGGGRRNNQSSPSALLLPCCHLRGCYDSRMTYSHFHFCPSWCFDSVTLC